MTQEPIKKLGIKTTSIAAFFRTRDLKKTAISGKKAQKVDKSSQKRPKMATNVQTWPEEPKIGINEPKNAFKQSKAGVV